MDKIGLDINDSFSELVKCKDVFDKQLKEMDKIINLMENRISSDLPERLSKMLEGHIKENFDFWEIDNFEGTLLEKLQRIKEEIKISLGIIDINLGVLQS